MSFRNWLVTEETKKQNIKKIDIFDFDGTVFYSPDEKIGREIVEKYNAKNKNKIKLEKHCYYLDPKSLEPPIVPSPAPCVLLNQQVATEFYNSQRDAQRLTVLMTGRPPYFKEQIQRILDDFKLNPDRLYLMPEQGHTVDNKIDFMAKLLDEFPHIEEIEIWDDRGPEKAKRENKPKENHLGEFRKFLAICKAKRQNHDSTWKLKYKLNEVAPQK